MSQRRPTETEIRDARRLLGVGPGAPRATILKAWREAVRRNHPDAAAEADRGRAEALCSRINAAKDMLLLNPTSPPRAAPPPPPPRAPSQARKPAAPAGAGASDDGYVPTGVAPGAGITPPRTGLLLTFLAVGFLAVLGIMALTTRNDDAAGGSRIGGATGAGTGTVATPAEAMATVMAAGTGQADGLDTVTAPGTHRAEVDDIVRRLAAADPGERAQARATTTCEELQAGISDRASCTIAVPADLLPHPVEMRRVDGSWTVQGYLPGR